MQNTALNLREQRMARRRQAKVRIWGGLISVSLGTVVGQAVQPYSDNVGHLIESAGFATVIVMWSLFFFDMLKLMRDKV